MQFVLNDVTKQQIFAETYLYEAVGGLPVMPSLLPHVLWGRGQVSLFFASVVSPSNSHWIFDIEINTNKILFTILFRS